MARKIGSRTIYVERRVRRDRLDRSASSAAPSTHEIEGCLLLPRMASGTQGNENDKGWVITEGSQLLMPYGADLLADDIVRLEPSGEPWEVDGTPGSYENRRGKGKVSIAFLKRLGT